MSKFQIRVEDVYEIEADDEHDAEQILRACRDNGSLVSTSMSYPSEIEEGTA